MGDSRWLQAHGRDLEGISLAVEARRDDRAARRSLLYDRPWRVVRWRGRTATTARARVGPLVGRAHLRNAKADRGPDRSSSAAADEERTGRTPRNGADRGHVQGIHQPAEAERDCDGA